MRIYKQNFFFCAFLLVSLLFLADTAQAAETDVVSQIVAKFKQKTDAWESSFVSIAQSVFYVCITLEVAWIGIQIALRKQDLADAVSQLAMTALAGGFFLSVISNYKEWSWIVINGLMKVAQEMGPMKTASEAPLLIGMEIIDKFFVVIAETSFWDDAGKIFGLVFASLIVLICFALITAQIVLIKCEAMVAMMAALILMGFGGTSFLRDYAKNALRYVFSVAFKLFVMYLVLGVGMSFLEEFQTTTSMGITEITVIVGATIVVLALVKSLPDTVGGLINGAHVGGGTVLMSTAKSVGSATSGAVTGTAAKVMRGTMNTRDAANIANLQGKSGMGKVGATMGNLASAGLGSMRGKHTTMGDALRHKKTDVQHEIEKNLAKEMMK